MCAPHFWWLWREVTRGLNGTRILLAGLGKCPKSILQDLVRSQLQSDAARGRMQEFLCFIPACFKRLPGLPQGSIFYLDDTIATDFSRKWHLLTRAGGQSECSTGRPHSTRVIIAGFLCMGYANRKTTAMLCGFLNLTALDRLHQF